MNKLLNLLILIILLTLSCTTDLEIPVGKKNDLSIDKKIGLNANSGMTTLRSDEINLGLYERIISDSEYITIVKEVNATYNNLQIPLSADDRFDKDKFKSHIKNILENPAIIKMSSYVKNVVNIHGNNKIVMNTILKSNNTITARMLIDPTIVTQDDCELDYGKFSFENTAGKKLNCAEIEDEYGCCFKLYCEEHNCETDAYNEFLEDIGLTKKDGAWAAFAIFIDYLKADAIAAISSINTYLLVQTVSFGFEFVDLIFDSMACAIEPVFNQNEWSAECGCVCSLQPECDFVNENSDLGGYNISEHCN